MRESELIKTIAESLEDEALAKKTLAQYQSRYQSLERPWDHVTLMYGLGLIYMHFNAYNWAIKAFRETLYVQPSFPKARDIHTRLGLIFKATGHFELSEKHFNLAISDTRPDSGSSSRHELEFHLAHLAEIQGKFKQARDAYERLLQENNLPQQLSANIHRQLGWMYFQTDLDPSTLARNQHHQQQQQSKQQQQTMFTPNQQPVTTHMNRIDAALNYLNIAYRTDNDSKTSYYLGRCFTTIGKFQNAFASYRSVIDREESTADTWCSIGVLYHRQNQLTDALQAYIRAVQFDKQHSVAWMNLGILYESHNQFYDALKCYKHASRSKHTFSDPDSSLRMRINYLQKQIAEVETSLGNSRKLRTPDVLLSLEDLWNLESKTSSEQSPSKDALTSSSNVSRVPALPCSSSNSTQSGDQQLSLKTETKPQITPTTTKSPSDHQRNGLLHRDEKASTTSTTTAPSPSSGHADKIEPTNVDSKPKHLINNTNSIHPNNNTTNQISLLNNDCKISKQQQPQQQQHQPETQASQNFKLMDSQDFNLNQVLTNGASKDSGISSNSSTSAECALIPSQDTELNLSNDLSAEQVIDICKNSPKPRKVDINLLNDEDKPPDAFPRVPPYPPIPSDRLFPSPPCIFLETKKDASSKKLQDCCTDNPISIVRSMASVLKLDLGLFSTKTLVESNSDHQVDIISHVFQPNNGENLDPVEDKRGSQNLWSCKRTKSSTTISNYASYQVGSFRESLIEERENKAAGSKTTPKDCETDSNESSSMHAKKPNLNGHSSTQTNDNSNLNNNQSSSNSKGGPPVKKLKRDPLKVRMVKYADQMDLSDEKKWRPQLNELYKLPNFVKFVSASNMLTHIGAIIPGVNTITMGMHVPGSRILGNRTPNRFCSVNLNVGPGDYEWCAISEKHSEALSRLCNKNSFEMEESDWWPKLGDLQKYNIPIFRFSQRPGDLVWINSGTIYWINATGWSNNIHWNVGPLCAKQYKQASESIELNKLLYRRSDVPMVQLTWNIVMNINIIADEELHHYIVNVLRRSLRYCAIIAELVEQSKIRLSPASEEPGPRDAKHCSLCECEVFNVVFRRKGDSDTRIHCIECARRFDPHLESYEAQREYDIRYLMELYDNFIANRRKFQAHQKRLIERNQLIE